MDKRIFYFDISIALISVILLFFVRPDFLMIALFILTPIYMYATRRKILLRIFLVAFLIALIWVSLARNYYDYNVDLLEIFSLDVYPMLAWTLGLFIAYIIYSQLKRFNVKKFYGKTLLFTAIYWPLLIIIEIFGYHILKLKDMENMYPGLPICDCIHTPLWMKFAYFSIGIVFIIIIFSLKLDEEGAKAKLF